MCATRKSYPSDVTDAEWEFLLPYLALMRADVPQREDSLRDLFDAMRYVVKTGCQWRYLPHDFPPWSAVYQQARRWLAARVLEDAAHDLRELIRLVIERGPHPTAAIMDGRTLQSTPESGGRASFEGHKKKQGSKVRVAVDTLGHLLTLVTTPADEQERAQVATLADNVRRSAVKACKSHSSIKAIPARRQRRAPNNTESSWKWSSTRKPNAALYCCRSAGSSNVPSVGWGIFAA